MRSKNSVGADAKKTQSDVYWRAANPIGILDYTKQGEVLNTSDINEAPGFPLGDGMPIEG